MKGWPRGEGSVERCSHAPYFIVSMSPPSYPSARLRPRRAGFRFTRRFSLSLRPSSDQRYSTPARARLAVPDMARFVDGHLA